MSTRRQKMRFVRWWLLVTLLAALDWVYHPGVWLCLAPLAAPIIWTRTSGGSTGILIHPDGPPWAIAVGDSEDETCECCGCGCHRCENSTAPCAFQAVVTDVANGTCSECDYWNGTFGLDVYEGSADPGEFGQMICQWTYTDTAPCSLLPWLFTIYRTGGGTPPPDPPNPELARRSYTMTYNGSSGGGGTAPFNHWFGKADPDGGTDKTSCDLVDEDIPPVTFADPTPPCDLTSGTCLITAL